MKCQLKILLKICFFIFLLTFSLGKAIGADAASTNLAKKNLQLKSEVDQLSQQVEQAHQNLVDTLNTFFQGIAKNLTTAVTNLETAVNDLDTELNKIGNEVGNINVETWRVSKITTNNLINLFQKELSSGGATTSKLTGGGLSYSDFSGISTTLKGQFALATSSWATGLSGPFVGSIPIDELNFGAETHRIQDALEGLINLTKGVIASEKAFEDSINKLEDSIKKLQ